MLTSVTIHSYKFFSYNENHVFILELKEQCTGMYRESFPAFKTQVITNTWENREFTTGSHISFYLQSHTVAFPNWGSIFPFIIKFSSSSLLLRPQGTHWCKQKNWIKLEAKGWNKRKNYMSRTEIWLRPNENRRKIFTHSYIMIFADAS